MKLKKYSIIFLFVIFFILFSCQKQSETTSPSEEAICEDKAISADGVSISYQVQGKGRPALVFVHGWCCDKSYWEAQLTPFAQQHKVVAIDLAGHGESGLDRKDWTIAAFGEDVAAVVKKLDLKQVVLIGHSMGGPVILAAARLMPKQVIGLVGVDTFNDIEWKYTQEETDEFLAPLYANFAKATDNFVRSMFTDTADSALVEKIAADMSVAPPEVGIGAFKGMINFMKNDSAQVLQELKAPIRCINSDMKPTNVEAILRYAPSFKVVFMSGVGHFLMMEDAETFNRLLGEVVQELVSMAASE